jgi:hypothetical protein
MSSFTDKKGHYLHPRDEEDEDFGYEKPDNEVPIAFKVSKVFEKGKKLDYQYDFGSTTYLAIEVKEEFAMPAQNSIVLLSRNEPLKIMCCDCGTSPATAICATHIHLPEGKGYFFCEKCAKKHGKKCEDFADYARLEVVNSPRMGVCAYEGGAVDTERDGVYGEKADS